MNEAGVLSTLPAASTARKSSVNEPGVVVVKLCDQPGSVLSLTVAQV